MGDDLKDGFLVSAVQLEMCMNMIDDNDCKEIVSKVNDFLERVAPE